MANTAIKTAPSMSSNNVPQMVPLHAIDRSKIYIESVAQDVMMKNANFAEVIETAGNTADAMGSGEIVKLRPEGAEGTAAQDVTVSYQKTISDDAIEGAPVTYRGNESFLQVKQAVAYANSYGRNISEFGFGPMQQENDFWKLSTTQRARLSQWNGEYLGFYLRQAFCERLSQNLAQAPISKTLSINPNVYFPETGLVSAGAATAASVATAAAALTTVVAGQLTVPKILQLQDTAAASLYIKPFNINGGKYWKLYCSREDVRGLRDPSQTGSFASYYIAGSALAKVLEVVPEAAMVIGETIIILDDRAPTATCTGGTTVAFGYVKAGRKSTRVAGTVNKTHFNVCIMTGQNAMLQYDREMVNFKQDQDDYGQMKGTLIYASTGFNLPVFTGDKYNGSTWVSEQARNEGSIIVLTPRTSLIGN